MRHWKWTGLVLVFGILGLMFQAHAVSAAKAKRPASEPAAASGLAPSRPLATFVELGSIRCVPCKMMQPVMDEIEKQYSGKVKVIFHDVWTAAGRPYAEQYGIRGIPTQVFLDAQGKEFHRHMGFYPKDEIVKVLKAHGID